MVLGITGGSGCGKTTLLELIREQGGLVLDCDAIYHQLLQEDQAMLSAIETRFPGSVKEGVLDRKALGAVVFSNETALQDLNRITHAAVKKVVVKALATQPDLSAIDAIGLFEGGLAGLCDATIAVTAPMDVRVARLMARDGITEEYARMRIQAQHTDTWFSKHCDYTLVNDTTREAFQSKCLAFLDELGIIKSNCRGG